MIDTSRIWWITTCKNRLDFLKQTFPKRLLIAPGTHLVVDYDCPQGTKKWVDDRPQIVSAGGFRSSPRAIRIDDRPIFNKCEAYNVGARFALEQGATLLIFIDADTVLLPEGWDWLHQHINMDEFVIVRPAQETRDLTGFLAVNARKFVSSGGFDERMRGWGGEDLDMRLRLYFKMRMPFVEMPPGLLGAIEHGEELRTQNYETKNKMVSHHANLDLLCQNVYDWTGVHLARMQDRDWRIRRLLGVYITPEEFRKRMTEGKTV